VGNQIGGTMDFRKCPFHPKVLDRNNNPVVLSLAENFCSVHFGTDDFCLKDGCPTIRQGEEINRLRERIEELENRGDMGDYE
jgi:hypothetical protein